MRTPPLLADFIHSRACKPICTKSLTLPLSLMGNSNIAHRDVGYPLSLWVSAWVVSPGRLPGLTEIQEFYLHLADGQSAFDILIGQGLPLQLGATELLGHQAGDNGAENGGDNDGSSHGCGGGLHLVG